jgi:peptide/nickel transport system permease protein
MKIHDYIFRRLLLIIPVIIGITFITFLLSHMMGDPAAAWLSEKTAGNEALRAQIVKAHHLDDPLTTQYYYYLTDLLHFDLGITGKNTGSRPVTDALSDYFPATLELAIVSMIFAVMIGIPLGIISAIKKDRWPDHLTRIFSLIGVSMPIFWFGCLLQLLLAYQFKVLPLDGRFDSIIGGVAPPARVTGIYLVDSLIEGDINKFYISLRHLIMPAFCLAYLYLAIITRMMRSSMLDTMTQDFIRTARAKGLSEFKVIFKHALRNALTPTLTVIGLTFGGLLSGAVLTETIFSWPGLGRFSTQAVLNADFASIMGFTLIIVIIYVFANLFVDILYVYLDPRVKIG